MVQGLGKWGEAHIERLRDREEQETECELCFFRARLCLGGTDGPRALCGMTMEGRQEHSPWSRGLEERLPSEPNHHVS